jgi:predicted acetyltransferase
MDLEIVPAGVAEEAIINNMARFYIYDMAEHAGWPFPDDGSFEAGDMFAPYWGKLRKDDQRPWPREWHGHPFLCRLDGSPAGFALVVEKAHGQFDMGEFYTARQHRRHGLGRHFATAMFDRFAGRWEVREMLTNVNAQAFWRRIIDDYTRGHFSDATESFAAYGGRQFVVQRFDSGLR